MVEPVQSLIFNMWSESIIVPIFKTGSKSDPSNYRGISLINVMYKIFSAIVNDRLTFWSEAYHVIDESQAGFRAGYSVIDNIFTLQSMIQKYISKQGGRFCVLYVDFLKAFDGVNHLSLFKTLAKNGVKGKIMNVLISMYSNMSSQVRHNDMVLTESFMCNIETRQGDLCSPKIFSLYINELV